jgi:Zn-dependent protease with chaperone function
MIFGGCRSFCLADSHKQPCVSSIFSEYSLAVTYELRDELASLSLERLPELANNDISFGLKSEESDMRVCYLSKNIAPKINAMVELCCCEMGLKQVPRLIFLYPYDDVFVWQFPLGASLLCLGDKPILTGTDLEIKSTIAHEIGHIQQHRTIKMLAATAGMFVGLSIGCICGKNLYFSRYSQAQLSKDPCRWMVNQVSNGLILVASLYGAFVVGNACSRYLEKDADLRSCYSLETAVGNVGWCASVEKKDASIKKLSLSRRIFSKIAYFFKRLHADHPEPEERMRYLREVLQKRFPRK